MNSIKWYIVNKEYVEYLHSFDNKVENINYDNNIKPYLGILINIYEHSYYVPVSSPKSKHFKFKTSLDFYKIEDLNGKLIGVLNLNNMIPIPSQFAERLIYSNLDKYKNFSSEIEKINYINLLSKELNILNRDCNKIIENSQKVYEHVILYPESNLALRCCNFKLLEEKCREYIIKINKI